MQAISRVWMRANVATRRAETARKLIRKTGAPHQRKK
jgi:hypothetical protein